MDYYTRNSDPNYYEKHCSIANCGSYAFNIQEWYDAEESLEWDVGYIEDWIKEMAEDYSDDEITDIYTSVLVDQILEDFADEIRVLNSESDPLNSDEELIAFRTFCFCEDWVNWDFHFKVFRDGGWKEKCGGGPVRFCTLEDWSNGINTYTSQTYFFAHRVS